MSSNWDKYAITGLATVAGIQQLVRFTQAVGKSRGKFGVKPPETDGPPEFLRTFRAHQNCIEFYPMSVTGLWVASAFFHPVPASVAYLGHLYGREKYFKDYAANAEDRVPGFYISIRCLKAIFLMCVLGVGHKMVRNYGNVDLWELITNNVSTLRK